MTVLRDELAFIRSELRQAREVEHQQHLKLKEAGSAIGHLLNAIHELLEANRIALEVLEENDLLGDPRIDGAMPS